MRQRIRHWFAQTGAEGFTDFPAGPTASPPESLDGLLQTAQERGILIGAEQNQHNYSDQNQLQLPAAQTEDARHGFHGRRSFHEDEAKSLVVQIQPAIAPEIQHPGTKREDHGHPEGNLSQYRHPGFENQHGPLSPL